VTRVTLILLAALTACALGLVTSQHQARKLFTEIEEEQERARSLETEYGQLQLEQSTWAMHARVQKLAAQVLHMRSPDARRVAVVPPAPMPGVPQTVR
jgi:cell division protein FtsL